MILEDMRENAIRLDQFHGGQGGDKMQDERANSLKSEEAWKLAFEAIAETHAKYWNKPEDIDVNLYKNLKGVDWTKGENREGWECSINAVIRAWA